MNISQVITLVVIIAALGGSMTCYMMQPPDKPISRGTVDCTAAGKKIEHSATRLLIEYEQAILAKTGYQRNAGFNGVLLAESGNRRLITVMFGGKSTKTMIAQMSKLSTSGFIKAAGGLESDIDKLKPLSSADII